MRHGVFSGFPWSLFLMGWTNIHGDGFSRRWSMWPWIHNLGSNQGILEYHISYIYIYIYICIYIYIIYIIYIYISYIYIYHIYHIYMYIYISYIYIYHIYIYIHIIIYNYIFGMSEPSEVRDFGGFSHLDVREFFQVIRMLRSQQKKNWRNTLSHLFFRNSHMVVKFSCVFPTFINQFFSSNGFPLGNPLGFPLASPSQILDILGTFFTTGSSGAWWALSPWVPEIGWEILAEVDPIEPPPNMMKTHGDPIRRTIDNRKWIYFG